MFNKFFEGSEGCGEKKPTGCGCNDCTWIIALILLLCNCGCKVDPCLLILILLILNCCGCKKHDCGC